jgi:hypothetical protein
LARGWGGGRGELKVDEWGSEMVVERETEWESVMELMKVDGWQCESEELSARASGT